MIALPETAHLVVGLMALGTGLIFVWTDRDSPPSRALSICLMALGARFLFDAFALPMGLGGKFIGAAFTGTLEGVSIFAGVEWARRISHTATGRLRRTANGLFVAALILVVVYWFLTLGYAAIYTDMATTDAPGIIKMRGLEFAVLAPVLGSAILITGIAIMILLFSGIDKAEAVRLRAIYIAGPFLIAGLIVNKAYETLTVAIGLLIFLSGAIRYLIIQGQRGQFMSQFLSPEVAKLVRSEGMKQALKRERRPISVVVCDLRGFTAFARERDSRKVMDVLQEYYAIVGDVASKHAGTVKDHAGDGVLILVGAPIPLKDHARQAAQLALELIHRVQAYLQETTPELGMGIGVATGKATVGAIRGAGRYEYAAVGTVVNLAARLCSRAADGEILADDRTEMALKPSDAVSATAREPEQLKGFPDPVPVYALSVPESSVVEQPEEEVPFWKWWARDRKKRRKRRRDPRRSRSRR